MFRLGTLRNICIMQRKASHSQFLTASTQTKREFVDTSQDFTQLTPHHKFLDHQINFYMPSFENNLTLKRRTSRNPCNKQLKAVHPQVRHESTYIMR